MALHKTDCGPKNRNQKVKTKWHFIKLTVAKKIGAKRCKIKWHFLKLTVTQKIGAKRCKIKWHFLKLKAITFF